MDPYRAPEHMHGYRLATPPRRVELVAIPRRVDEVELCAGPPAPRPVQVAGSGLLLRGNCTAPCGKWRILRLVPGDRGPGSATVVRRIDILESRHARRAVGTYGASSTRTLRFSLGHRMGVALNGERFASRSSFLVGSHAGPLRTRFSGDHFGIQVDLEPLAAYRLTGTPGAEFADRVVDLETLPSPIADLEERLAACPHPRARLAILERTLHDAILAGPEPDPLVAWLWGRLVQLHGRVRISDLVEEAGFSHRHVTSRFREQVGMTPKTAARILRFELAVELLSRGDSASEVAATCGYSDQSHLSREVACLGGSPPSVVATSNEGRWIWTH